ncbi:MAG: hypothetical protein O3C40_35270 [Planctomycetota bacterium]|nr:hypothetical protein [Planctomycetota bacterium]
MNSEQLTKIKQIACEYAKKETKYGIRTVANVAETDDYDDLHGRCYAVKMALSHSDEEIERLVSDGDPEEADIKRGFLEGDFILNLVVAGEAVVSAEWENMDVC